MVREPTWFSELRSYVDGYVEPQEAAIRAVESINQQAGRTIAAYTYDAGPNCVIYFLEEDEQTVVGAFYKFLSGVGGWKEEAKQAKTSVEIPEQTVSILKDGVGRVIQTGVGEGPEKTDEFLIAEDGSPVQR